MAITFLYTRSARLGGEKNVMKRRTFIETSVAAAAVFAARRSWAAASEHEIKKVGLQLYTVRTEMPKDFEGTIAKVAATGYKEVEFAGYFGHSPKDVRAILDKNGLTSPSSHESYDTVEKKLPETLEGAHVIGQTFLVCPYIDEKMRTADGYKRVAETFNKVGEASKKAGIQFAYHNHYWEFIPDAQLDGKFP